MKGYFLLFSGAVTYVNAQNPRLAASVNFLHMFKQHSSLPRPGDLLNLIKALPDCVVVSFLGMRQRCF